MKMKAKENSGITLIALVITIVVLIILASVAITLSLGDNGIFKKAAKAKEDTQVAQNEESMQIAETTNSMDEIVGGSDRATSTYSETLLWSGEGLSGNIELTNSIRNYNMIYFTYAYYNPGQANNGFELTTATFRPADIISQGTKRILLSGYDNGYVDLVYIDDTHMNIPAKNIYYLKSIYGIKY